MPLARFKGLEAGGSKQGGSATAILIMALGMLSQARPRFVHTRSGGGYANQFHNMAANPIIPPMSSSKNSARSDMSYSTMLISCDGNGTARSTTASPASQQS